MLVLLSPSFWLMKKYRFRKMFFRCIDNKVIEDNITMTNAYRQREDAQSVVESRRTHKMWEDKTKPVPVEKVEGFYLVHESLFEEVLKKYSKE